MQRRVMPFACALAFGVGAISYARADGLQPCAVEPFGEQPVDVQEAILRRGCGGEHTRWYVETPRAKESDPGPSMVRTQFDSVASEPLGAGLLGTVRMSWSGFGNEEEGGLRTERATVAAGGMWRFDDAFALQFSLGREMTGMPRSRATMAGVWSPIDSGVFFAEWAGSQQGTENHRFGARWWLLPRHLAIDVSARQLPEGGGLVDHRYGLTFSVSPGAMR
jgi:hypothetical protein